MRIVERIRWKGFVRVDKKGRRVREVVASVLRSVEIVAVAFQTKNRNVESRFLARIEAGTLGLTFLSSGVLIVNVIS